MRKRLVQNFYAPGTAIPSEFQLAEELGVSQGTARRALNGLVDEGLLLRRQGVGTFVPKMDDRRSLFLFFNMVAHDGRQEMPAAKVISVDTGAATKQEADKLAVTIGAPVRRLQRIRLFRNKPTIIELVIVSESVLPGLGDDKNLPDHLFRYYEAKFKVTVVKADESVRAVAASDTEAKILGISAGTPLLEIERLARSIDNRPVEWRLSRCNTASHDYRIARG